MSKKVFVLLSMDPEFIERFRSFLNNLNAVNTDRKHVVVVEDAYTTDYIAVPKEKDRTNEHNPDADVCNVGGT
jgi:hypothetical protein